VRNAESGAGNVIVFETGAFFRFETIEIAKGRVVLGLGDQGRVTVPEQVVDFEESVREGATVRLPRTATRADVVKSKSSDVSTARGGEAPAAMTRAERAVAAKDRSQRARAAGRAGGRRATPGSTASRRQASLDGSLFERGFENEGGESSPGRRSPTGAPLGQDAEGGTEDGATDPAQPDGLGMRDPAAVRRQAEERGEDSGTLSVIVSSADSVDVAGVQFRLNYPSNCSPAGAQTIGAFSNASMSQPNGSVGGRPIFAMAIVYAADDTTSLPGEIARVDFTWVGVEPDPADFKILSASASDHQGNAERGFRAEAHVLR
jgi:hypothetical protein